MNSLKVAIILPVYNVASYLRECLDSILSQEYDNFIVIAVNDGSTDDSRGILESYAKKDSRIIVLDQENSGISSVRNRALELIESMKDIDYHGQKKYEENFTPAQLEWLKKDLSYVQPGSLVLLNVHAPVANRSHKGGGNARNAAQLFEILKGYKVHIFSGHTHFYENAQPAANIYEHNRCGAPNGYLLVNVQGDDTSWQYKATGRPLDYQFRVYKPEEFQSQPEYLVVNIWDYDPAWTVQYYEDGIEKKGVL